MKSTSKLFVFVLTLLAVAASAYAQSPREQLQQMVEQLQKTPNDNALRERIIKLGTEIKPAPAVPEEANRFFVRGNVFQKEAKDASGYDLAISAYRDALRVAPWLGDAYFNLAVALESSGKFDEAIASIKLYMASVPAGSAEAREAQNRVYAIETKSEMASKQTAMAKQMAESQARRFEGNWYRVANKNTGTRTHLTLSLKRDAGGVWHIDGHESPASGVRDIQFVGSELRFKLYGRVVNFEVVVTVTPDGNVLRLARTPMPLTASQAKLEQWSEPVGWIWVVEYQRQ